MKKHQLRVTLFLLISLICLHVTRTTYGKSEVVASPEIKNATKSSPPLSDAKSQAVERDETLDIPTTTGPLRRFHEVLDELLIEFGYDLKMGQVNGIKNLAIRKTEVNEVLPNSYRKYVRMLINERIQM